MGTCATCNMEVADDQMDSHMQMHAGDDSAAAPAEGGEMGGEEAAPAEGGEMGGEEAAPAEGGDAPAEGGDAAM